MDFQELIRRRSSVRAYRSDPVSDALLQQVLEAAWLAPTANNQQPFGLVVVRTEGKRADLGRIYHRSFFTQAPLVIGVCGVASQGWVRKDGRRYLDVDVAIVMDHLILAAADAGLGTCWVAAFDARAAREVLKLPETVEPIVFTPLGWPAEAPREKQRKPLAELVRYETW